MKSNNKDILRINPSIVREQNLPHPFIQNSSIIKAICNPILKEFNIRCFSHYRVYQGQYYTGAISDLDWAEKYLNHGLQDHDIHSFNVNKNLEAYIVWSRAHVHDSLEKVRRFAHTQNLSNGITLTFRNGKFYDFFGFAGANDDHAINETLIVNKEMLIRFIFYYLNETTQHKKLAEHYTDWRPITNPKNVPYCSAAYQYSDSLADVFLSKRYYVNVIGNNTYFTNAQMKCLALLFKRKTAKEIAQILDLSCRTVQEHIYNMRDKVGAISISDLCAMLAKNDYIQWYCYLYNLDTHKRSGWC